MSGGAEAPTTSHGWWIPLRVSALAAVEHEVQAFLGAAVDDHAAFVGQLVVEEIVRNLAEHGSPCDGDVAHVRIDVTATRVTVTIENQLAPFDPRGVDEPELSASLDERRPGGLGVHLVRELTDGLTYERREGRNRLTAWVERS